MHYCALSQNSKLAYGTKLLSETQLTMADIVLLLGYSDRTKFEKAFRRAHGITPSVYRRLQETPLPPAHTVRNKPKYPTDEVVEGFRARWLAASIRGFEYVFARRMMPRQAR